MLFCELVEHTLVYVAVGIVEAPFRICLSWMSDRFKLRPASLLSVSFFVMGVCGQGFVLAPSHATMIAYAVIHGTLGGLTTVRLAFYPKLSIKMSVFSPKQQ